MNLPDALTASSTVRDALLPYCLRCEVAGSIRRGEESPGDIDIVLIPSPERPQVFFGQKTPIFKTVLDDYLWHLEQVQQITRTSGGDKLKKYTVDITKWGVAMAISQTVKMQLTVATPDTWAYWYLIRTGPADFSHWIVTPKAVGGALPDGHFFNDCRLHGVYTSAYGEGPYTTPEEIHILELLGLPWIEPKDRKANWRKS